MVLTIMTYQRDRAMWICVSQQLSAPKPLVRTMGAAQYSKLKQQLV
jgi:hypothetical protein